MEVLCKIIHSMTSGFWERPLRHWKKTFSIINHFLREISSRATGKPYLIIEKVL